MTMLTGDLEQKTIKKTVNWTMLKANNMPPNTTPMPKDSQMTKRRQTSGHLRISIFHDSGDSRQRSYTWWSWTSDVSLLFWHQQQNDAELRQTKPTPTYPPSKPYPETPSSTTTIFFKVKQTTTNIFKRVPPFSKQEILPIYSQNHRKLLKHECLQLQPLEISADERSK